MALSGNLQRSEGLCPPPSVMFGDAVHICGGEGVTLQVKLLLSSLLLREGPQCLLQQEETEGQSTDLLSSCRCDGRLSVLFCNVCLTHAHTATGREKER